MLCSFPDDKNGACRQHHANAVKKDREAQDLVEGVCEKKHDHTDDRVDGQAYGKHIPLFIFFTEYFGQYAVFTHSVHHPGIAHQQHIDIGQYGNEKQDGKDKASSGAEHPFGDNGCDAFGGFQFLKSDDLEIRETHGKIKYNDQQDTNEDPAGQVLLGMLHLIAEIDGLLIPAISERDRDKRQSKGLDIIHQGELLQINRLEVFYRSPPR